MYQPRRIACAAVDTDPDGIKVYTIAATGRAVELSAYVPQLLHMKSARPLVWRDTPAFAIFHDGASARYLVLGWWGNDNEMFIAVAVERDGRWIEDTTRYSFCLWDMEVMWHERNAFVQHMYRGTPDLAAYRTDRLIQTWPVASSAG